MVFWSLARTPFLSDKSYGVFGESPRALFPRYTVTNKDTIVVKSPHLKKHIPNLQTDLPKSTGKSL